MASSFSFDMSRSSDPTVTNYNYQNSTPNTHSQTSPLKEEGWLLMQDKDSAKSNMQNEVLPSSINLSKSNSESSLAFTPKEFAFNKKEQKEDENLKLRVKAL